MLFCERLSKVTYQGKPNIES